MGSEQIITALKDSGMRITKQRMLVATVIAEKDGASCKDICYSVKKIDGSIGTATVYRMIKALEDIGVIERIDIVKLKSGEE